jgi:AcrR family transcriptional regulator
MGLMTFKNLNADKRQRILQSAHQEFCRAKFPNILISNIVAQAKIPRGSFYQYFDSIEDIFSVLLIYLFGKETVSLEGIYKEQSSDLKQTLKVKFMKMIDRLEKQAQGFLLTNMALVKIMKPDLLFPQAIEPNFDEDDKIFLNKRLKAPAVIINLLEQSFKMCFQSYLQAPKDKEKIVIYFNRYIDLLLEKEETVGKKNEIIVKTI